LGTFLALLIGPMATFVEGSLAFAVGQFLYLSLTMLLPQIKENKTHKIRYFVLFIIGIAIMSILVAIPHSHEVPGEEGHDHGHHH